MASGEQSSKQEIPLEEIQHYRGVAQEQSMNALHSAQQRYENAPPDSNRDCIYDAIADAKKQISEKDKIPFGGKVNDQQEDNTVGDARKEKEEEGEESASKGVLSSLGDTLSGYTKTVKDAVAGGDVADSDNSK